jgi:pimeloyl-ACP methyl ester carboxylesterase
MRSQRGPPLVLLHGAGATSLMWAPNIGALSEQFQTFAAAQIGEFGKSICTNPVHSIADLLAWLDELFEALGLARGINCWASRMAAHWPPSTR